MPVSKTTTPPALREAPIAAAPMAAPAPTLAHLAHSEPEPLGLRAFKAMDRTREALIAQFTGGVSPAALSLAYTDWAMHLSIAQGKLWELGWKTMTKAARLQAHAGARLAGQSVPPCIEPLPGDHRFDAKGWRDWPFHFFAQSFLLQQQWWHNATHEVPGVSPHHEAVVAFVARQLLDMASPSNFAALNPEVLAKIRETGGANLAQGAKHWLEDAARLLNHQPPAGAEAFIVGENVAATPGRVVARTHLMELIQYAPATPEVAAEPILIVPAWIMKYYILDLSAHNSLIKYLVAQGRTVFCISWRNPGPQDRDLSFDDYRTLGVMAALEAVNAILPGAAIHGVGYCLGGTLFSIAAAAMAKAGDERLASLTLLAAQTDFSEPGELALFIDHSQTHFLDSMMWSRGALSAEQMAGAFALLRSNDLIWSRMVRNYLMGEREAMNDLAAWNADATRMPFRMHSDYLNRLYLNNELARGSFLVEGRPAAIANIRAPFFVVGAERDHVAPWTSVFKIHILADAEIAFVLTSGGHNVGIVNPPQQNRGHFRIAVKSPQGACLSAPEWQAAVQAREGSWWPAWIAWLNAHSSGARAAPPPFGAPERGFPPLGAAPGDYVLQR